MTLQTLIVDGCRIRYVDEGDPAASGVLVLIHGFPLGVQMWAPQISVFEGWRVMAPALHGFDGSDLAAEPSIDTYARAALALIERLEDGRRVVVAGLSMGGYVAFSVARQARGRIAGLILADTRSGVDTADGAAGRRRMLDLVARGGAQAVAEDLVPKLLGRTSLERRPDVAVALRRMIEAQSTEAISAATRAMMTRPDSTSFLPRLRMPTLILVGEEDTLIPPPESERMHAAIGGSTLIRIPEAGHMSNMEDPAAFNAAVDEFLKKDLQAPVLGPQASGLG
jgi:3-oxoadipate enol-lactonase